MNNINDEDYMNLILESEKNLANVLNTAINEASNDKLFNKFYDMYDDIKETIRETFNIMLSNNWYELKQTDEKNIKEARTKLNEKTKKLK